MPDEFDEALQCTKIGRRFQTDHKWLSNLALLVHGCVDGILQNLRDQKSAGRNKIPDILSGVNDSPEFNAVAFEHKGRCVLAVNYGVLILGTGSDESIVLPSRCVPMGR